MFFGGFPKLTCIEQFKFLSGECYFVLLLGVEAVQEVGVEQLGGEVERKLLDVQERVQQLDHLTKKSVKNLKVSKVSVT